MSEPLVILIKDLDRMLEALDQECDHLQFTVIPKHETKLQRAQAKLEYKARMIDRLQVDRGRAREALEKHRKTDPRPQPGEQSRA